MRAVRCSFIAFLGLCLVVLALGHPTWSQPPLPKEFAQAQTQQVMPPPLPPPKTQSAPSSTPPTPVPLPPSLPPPPVDGRSDKVPPPQPGPPNGTSLPAPVQNGQGAFNQQKPAPKRGDISLNFDDADVYSVIQTIFGGVLRYNYIIDPKVKGRVNFRSVTPVGREDVLPLMEVILRLNGIGVVEEGGLYRIIPIADMSKEPAPVSIGRTPEKVTLSGLGLLQVVPIKYFSSTEMVRVLTPFLSANAVIVDVPKINYLIIVDTDANVKRLLHLIEIFDSEQLKQIKPQVYVYPVQNSKAKDLSALLQQIYLGTAAPPRTAPPAQATVTTPARPTSPAGGQTTPAVQSRITLGPSAAGEALVSDITKIFPDEVTNSLIILATPDDYALILETIRKIDIVPRQVMIEVLIAEITLGDDLQFGLEWSVKSKVDSNFFNFGFSPSETAATTGFTFLGIDKTGLIRGFLRTLATESKLSVLASPHILAMDNRKAKIQIGDQIPIVTSETNITGTTQIQRTIQYKDTGTMLEITPLINDGGLVNLEVSQEVSDYRLRKLYDDQEYPIIFKREAKTNLVVQDGQTIVIGGLIRDKTDTTRGGIPWLSKIPLLGYLFGSTTREKSRSEIVLLLTPKVIRNQQEAENLTSIYIHRLDGVTKDMKKMDLLLNKPQ
ncbi:MAG: secretin N-terminal domain-containing protein [Thermodesulfobacteriota bacterium]